MAQSTSQRARLFRQRLASATAIFDAIGKDGRLLLLAELEERIEADEADQVVERASRSATTTAPKKRPETFLVRAEQVVLANPQGLRTVEVADRIGQRLSAAHSSLQLLAQQGKIARHGSRTATLWTPIGATPVERVERIGEAIVHVLKEAGPATAMDQRTLKARVTAVVAGATKKAPASNSIAMELRRLSERRIIEKRGANEHGPTYGLCQTEVENDPPTLN